MPPSGRDVPGGGAAIYAVAGRLLVRTVDGSGGLGLERDETTVMDGHPGIAVEALGRAVVDAVDQAREVPRPTTWRKSSEYAAPLLAASPGRYRSYRAWQRDARYVSVRCRPGGWTIQRWKPDGRGWSPAEADAGSGGIPTRQQLPPNATAAEVGAAVLALLAV